MRRFIKPSEVRYSQDSINNVFDSKCRHSNTLIGATLDDLIEKKIRVEDIPLINVQETNDKWISADNRRLWVFKILEKFGMCETIPVQVVRYIPPHKLTSDNSGTWIRVRGDPGSRYYSVLISMVSKHDAETKATAAKIKRLEIQKQAAEARVLKLEQQKKDYETKVEKYELYIHNAEAKVQDIEEQLSKSKTSYVKQISNLKKEYERKWLDMKEMIRDLNEKLSYYQTKSNQTCSAKLTRPENPYTPKMYAHVFSSDTTKTYDLAENQACSAKLTRPENTYTPKMYANLSSSDTTETYNLVENQTTISMIEKFAEENKRLKLDKEKLQERYQTILKNYDEKNYDEQKKEFEQLKVSSDKMEKQLLTVQKIATLLNNVVHGQ